MVENNREIEDTSVKYDEMLRYFVRLKDRSSSSFQGDWKMPIESWCYYHELKQMIESVKYMTNSNLVAWGFNEEKDRVYVRSAGYNNFKEKLQLN